MIATLRKLMTMVNRPGRYITGLLLVGLVAATMNIFIGIAFMLFINSAQSADIQLLYTSLIYMSISLVAIFVLMPLGYWLYDTAVVHSTANLRRQVFRRALRLTASWLETKHSGDLTSRATNDVQAAEQAYSTNTVNIVEVLLSGIGCVLAMLIVDWRLALVIIALGLIRVGINSLFVKPMERAANAVQNALGKLTERISDIANGGHVIRMFNYYKPIKEKFREQNDEAVHHGMTRIRHAAKINWFNNLNGNLSFLGLIVAGGWLVMQGWYELGTIMLFVQLQNGVNSLFSALGHFITQLQTSLAGGRRALEIIEQDPEPERISLPAMPTITSDALSLENVSFAYTDNQHPALTDINLRVKEGETVALVGPSGGGKSTLFKLLLGYYPPYNGAISVLGKGMDQYSIRELRDLTAFVPQTPYLFSGTISENIGFGKPGASQGEIEEAAKAANAHDFISSFSDGYQTIVGERGSRLSGGQRQRIAIARAILRDAPILLLDEATSSLDTESEELVQQALNKLMKGRTTLVIAHRLSTIKDADRIVVIAEGKVAEEGSHQELLECEGIYRRLHDMQFAEDLEDAG